MNFLKNRLAFTSIEMVLVLALLAIFFGFAVLYSQTSAFRSDLYTQAEIFISYARLAQSDTLAGKDSGQAHGLHLGSSSYTLFVGNTYSPAASSNFIVELPSSLHFDTIALNGGGQDIVFEPPRGSTSTHGSFRLTSDTLNQSIFITLSSSGILHYEFL